MLIPFVGDTSLDYKLISEELLNNNENSLFYNLPLSYLTVNDFFKTVKIWRC